MGGGQGGFVRKKFNFFLPFYLCIWLFLFIVHPEAEFSTKKKHYIFYEAHKRLERRLIKDSILVEHKSIRNMLDLK